MSAQLDDFWLPDSRTPRTPVASQRPEKGVAIGRRGNNPSKVLKAIQEKKMAAESWRTAERDAVNSRRKLEKSLAEQRATQEKVMADKQAKLDQQLEKQRQAAVEQKAQADKIANAEKRAQAQKDLADQHAKHSFVLLSCILPRFSPGASPTNRQSYVDAFVLESQPLSENSSNTSCIYRS